MRVFSARFVVPVATAPVENGAVAIDGGRIVAVGGREEVLRRAGPEAPIADLGDAVILPGLVNAHTHLELAWMASDPPPGGDYTTWLRGLLERRAAADRGRAEEAARRAVLSLEARGTVAVGDVGNEEFVAPLLARSGLHAVVFHEVYGFAAADAERRLDEAIARLEAMTAEPEVIRAGDRLGFVLTPHAPHTTSVPLLRALAGRSVAAGGPLSIHVAESAAEVALLLEGGGPLAEFFRARGFWDSTWEPPGRSPVEHLRRLGVLSARTLAVHCVHVQHADRSTIQASGATVVTCPRSNDRLGVGRAPVPELLREGIPVALGTDSLASAPDLDLFAEIAALREQHPTITPASALRMATLNGARALGLADRLGTIEPGKLDALIVVPLPAGAQRALDAIVAPPARVLRLDNAARELAAAPP